jgi:hypothetical protein
MKNNELNKFICAAFVGIGIMGYFGFLDNMGNPFQIVLNSNSTDTIQKTWIANGTVFSQYSNGTITTSVPIFRQYWYMFEGVGFASLALFMVSSWNRPHWHDSGYDYHSLTSTVPIVATEEEDEESLEKLGVLSDCKYCGRQTATNREGSCEYCSGPKHTLVEEETA